MSTVIFVRLGSTNRQADLPLIEELKRTVTDKSSKILTPINGIITFTKYFQKNKRYAWTST